MALSPTGICPPCSEETGVGAAEEGLRSARLGGASRAMPLTEIVRRRRGLYR